MIITLTTDFGMRDPFVGMMRGVILGIAPDVKVVDMTHGVRAHDVAEASLFLSTSYMYFPKGTIHVLVVDPGVGSNRRPIILRADGHLFVAPDNGALTGVVMHAGEAEAYHITSTGHFLASPGRTFEGRDVFSPTAALLALGQSPESFGPRVEDFVALPFHATKDLANGVEGEVIHVDTFGNLITNITAAQVHDLAGRATGKPLKVRMAHGSARLVRYYAEAAGVVLGGESPGKPHALVNSCGMLELFVYKGNASRTLGMDTGDKVTVSY